MTRALIGVGCDLPGWKPPVCCAGSFTGRTPTSRKRNAASEVGAPVALIDAVTTDDAVATSAPGQVVPARFPVDLVIAADPANLVAPSTAAKLVVVAGAAVYAIVTRAAVQSSAESIDPALPVQLVVAGSAPEGVAIGATEELVIAVAARHDQIDACLVDQRAVAQVAVPLLCVDHVVAASAIDRVPVVPAPDDVVSAAAADHIDSVESADLVIAC